MEPVRSPPAAFAILVASWNAGPRISETWGVDGYRTKSSTWEYRKKLQVDTQPGTFKRVKNPAFLEGVTMVIPTAPQLQPQVWGICWVKHLEATNPLEQYNIGPLLSDIKWKGPAIFATLWISQNISGILKSSLKSLQCWQTSVAVDRLVWCWWYIYFRFGHVWSSHILNLIWTLPGTRFAFGAGGPIQKLTKL